MPRHRTPNERLPKLLDEAGWSGTALARAVNGLGRAQGLALRYDRTSVAHWVKGSCPRQPVPALVAQVLSTRIGRPVTEAETGLAARTGPSRPIAAELVEDDDPVRRLTHLVQADSDPQQRRLLHHLVYDPGFRTERRRPAREDVVAPRHTREAPGPGAISDMAGVFFQQRERYGGTQGRTALVAYLADYAVPVLTRAASASQRRGLSRELARATHVLAMMCEDSNLHGLAQRYHGVGLDLARNADDDALTATVLRALSVQASRLGHDRRALTLAHEAMRAAHHCELSPVRAFVLAQRAVAHAGAGLRREAVDDLSAAERELGASTPDAGHYFGWYPPAALRFQEGQALLALGDKRAGIRALEASVSTRAPEQRRARVLTRARLAQARLSLGHVEDGCHDYGLFLDEVSHLSCRRATSTLTTLHAALFPFHRYRPARSLLARSAHVRDEVTRHDPPHRS
ncbi:hypothetical protein [Streptomyces cacaoi]|uniref:hypothetical protein n=1 Tax=Streptomyces cacaoi TaxID=1898 RepID=UPI0033306446